ncbi:Xaa-Pro aminopeptidase [Streptomyces filamentosus]
MSTALTALRTAVENALDEFEKARAEEARAAGAQSSDPYEWVRFLAISYTSLADATPRTLEATLDDIAESLTLEEIRLLRLAGELAVAVTPRAARAARDAGQKPRQIADELGLTLARVYQVLQKK